MGEKTVNQKIPAPRAGLNSRDAIDAMDPNYALRLVNWIPGYRTVSREGYSQQSTHADMGSGKVEAIFEHVKADGTRAIIACANNKIFNCAAAAAVEITGTTTPSSNQWQGHLFRGSLILVNGTNTPQIYSTGTTRADATWTGPTIANIIGIGAYKNRQYFITKNSQSFWYADVNAIDGASPALVEFDCGAFMPRSGYIQWAQSFSKGTGEINNDFFVVATEQGDILLYSGDYPGNTWALSGKYQIAPTIGRKSYIHVPGDLWAITKQGIVSIGALVSGMDFEVTASIKSEWTSLVNSYSGNYGWCGVHYPAGGYTVVNIPINVGSTYDQLIITDTDRSCARFKSQNGVSFCISQNIVYFGGTDGKVYKVYGTDDNNSGIELDFESSFSDFGDPVNEKHFSDVRVNITSSDPVNISSVVNTDFSDTNLAAPSLSEGTALSWDFDWDQPWGSNPITRIIKMGIDGIGYSAAVRFKMFIRGMRVFLNNSLIRYHTGGE